MKIIPCILLFLSIFTCSFSQKKYDLIVFTNGDSIVCQIDSISDTELFFSMKKHNVWVQTSQAKDNISNYKKETIKWSEFTYDSGSSYIKSTKAEMLAKSSIHISSLILAIDYLWSVTVSYEYTLPLDYSVNAVLRGGTGITFESGEELVFMGDAGLLLGHNKHFLEGGVGYYQTFNASPSFFPHIGYRYMGKRGLIIRLGGQIDILTDKEWIDDWGNYQAGILISIGYRLKI